MVNRLKRRVGDESFLAFQNDLRAGADVVVVEENLSGTPEGYGYGQGHGY